MTHINQRRDTAANWASANPILQDGERGHEKDTRKSKTGDGVTHWNDLAYEVSAVSGTKADVGLGNVDNTSDMDKPLSVAQQAYVDAGDAALNSSKAPKASPAFTGTPTAPTPTSTDNTTKLATTAFVQTVAALSRAKRWTATTTYAVGDVVGYAGGVYRCTAAPTLAIPPAMATANWEVVVGPAIDDWAQTDPYFASPSLTNTWQTFWKTGTINSIGFTTTAGEFESGKRALKIDLAANSTQRLYPFAENIVKGGEVMQMQARIKYLSGTAGQPTVSAEIIQNDETGTPEPLVSGVSTTVSLEGTQTITNAWQTFTFTLPSVVAKQRAAISLIVGGGTAAAVIVVDWIKVRRRPEYTGSTALVSGNRAPDVWHTVGATGEPAFQNSWATPSGQATPGFIREGTRVQLRGRAGLASAPLNSVIFTLPVGYRPSVAMIFVVYSGTGGNGFAIVTVNTDGTVLLNAVGTNGNSTQVELGSITFSVV